MYCPNCGTKNEDDSLFCMECGTRLKKDTVLNQLPHQETTPMQPEGRTVTDADIPKNRQSGSQNNENPNNKNQDTRNQNMGNQNENPSDIRRNGNPGGQNDYGQNYGNANPVNLAGRGSRILPAALRTVHNLREEVAIREQRIRDIISHPNRKNRFRSLRFLWRLKL